MTPRTLYVRLHRALRRTPLAQIGLLWLLALAGGALARATGAPLPGGVVGLAALLTLLASGLVHPADVRRGATWLLTEMLLFFVPAVMALLDHPEFFGPLGLKILLIILAGTAAVMAATAATIELCLRLDRAHAAPAAALE
ncbi:MAG TPA: CidA/LrgA family protein [Steroidobacteraceae bacterium]|nr:CidA/LrgA family protein [Steroidobacteraceae bacterium]